MTRSTGVRLIGAVWLLASLSAAAAVAQDYPRRPISIVVPGTSGGSPDVMARLFAQRLSEAMGQQVVVDTVPGASGIIGVQKVVRAPADGYTVLYGFNQLVTMNPHLIPNLPYNPERDLAPVSILADLGYVWIANNDLPANTVAEWITLARAQPGKLSFGTTGPGSAANLGGELFMEQTGTRILAVAYKGNSNPDLIAGIINLKMEPYTTAIPLIDSKRVKALAITGAARLAVMPNVPTMAEALPGYVITGWHAVWLPANTPQAIVDRLNAEFVKVAKLPEMVERMRTVGLQPVAGTAQELRDLTREETAKWGRLIKSRNIKVE